MPSSNDKYERARKQRLGIAVAEPEAPKPEPGTMSSEWEDRKTRAAQRERAAQQQEEAKAKRSEEKRATAKTATGGTNLDAETIAAKAAYEKERRAPKNALVSFTFDSVMAVIEKYFDSEAGRTIYRTPDNYESFGNRFVRGLCLGEFDLTLAAAGGVHAELLQTGYLEMAPGESFDPATGVTVRNRGDVTRPASRVFPRFFHHSHEVQARLIEMYEGQQRFREGTQQLKKDLDSGKLSFADLQKSVRKNFKKGIIL
jgi:hypothetical protein